MTQYKNIEFSVESGVGIISLNRQEVLNSFNFEMADDTILALEYCKNNDEIRAIILTGNGRGFCAGQKGD